VLVTVAGETSERTMVNTHSRITRQDRSYAESHSVARKTFMGKDLFLWAGAEREQPKQNEAAL